VGFMLDKVALRQVSLRELLLSPVSNVPSMMSIDFSLIGKGKGTPNRPEGPERDLSIALLFLDLGASRGGWSAPHPGRFPPGKDLVPFVQNLSH
jgi:hypothetical protein